MEGDIDDTGGRVRNSCKSCGAKNIRWNKSPSTCPDEHCRTVCTLRLCLNCVDKPGMIEKYAVEIAWWEISTLD